MESNYAVACISVPATSPAVRHCRPFRAVSSAAVVLPVQRRPPVIAPPSPSLPPSRSARSIPANPRFVDPSPATVTLCLTTSPPASTVVPVTTSQQIARHQQPNPVVRLFVLSTVRPPVALTAVCSTRACRTHPRPPARLPAAPVRSHQLVRLQSPAISTPSVIPVAVLTADPYRLIHVLMAGFEKVAMAAKCGGWICGLSSRVPEEDK